MGIFDFLKGKKEEVKEVSKIKVVSPLQGKVISIKEVPDETFASKMLGDGVGIDPSGLSKANLVAPVDGTLVQLFETGHAFTVETKDGVNILVHCGLNTVELKGEGFEKIAEEGAKVKAGDVIVKVDFDLIKDRVPSIITPVVVLDSDDYKNIEVFLDQNVEAGKEVVMEIEK